MAISVVQGTSFAAATNGANATGNFGSNITAGNAVIIVVANDDGPKTQGAVSDGPGDTFTNVFSTADDGGGNGIDVYLAPSLAGGSTSVQVVNSGFDNLACTAYEVSGLANSVSCFDYASLTKPHQTTSPMTSNTITTSNANELLIGIHFDNSTTSPTSWTAGASFSNLEFTSSVQFTAIATQTQIVSSTGSYSTSISNNLSPAAFVFSWIIGFSDTAVTTAPNTLYLLNTTTITHPAAIDSATKSAALPAGTDHSPAHTTALDMTATAATGATDTNRTSTTGTSAVLTSAWHHTWVSNVLGGSNIAAGTWSIGGGWAENNAAGNQAMAASIYVLTSGGTVRGYVYDSATKLGSNFGTSAAGSVVTVSGSAVNGVLNTDQLVVEMWTTGTQTGTTSRTITSHWAGRSQPTNTTANNSVAAFIRTPPGVNIFASGGGGGGTVTQMPVSNLTNLGAS